MKNWFNSFVSSRHISRLFNSRNLADTLTTARGAASPISEPLSRDLMRAAKEDIPALLLRMHSGENGLTHEEARRRLQECGANEVEHEKPLSWPLHLWLCYKNPFNILLSVLALVSYLTADLQATTVITIMVLLSTTIRFVQEGRSNRSAERLKALVSNTVTVIRCNLASPVGAAIVPIHHAESASTTGATYQKEISIKMLVPGDHIALSAGDMIPADCRILHAKDLFVSQSAMTGEALPIEKFAERKSSGEAALDQANLLFMGTNVISGAATALVIATGNQTYFGTIAKRLTSTDRAPTAFQSGVNSVSWLLIRFALVMTPIVLFINGFTKGDWMEAFIFALSVAVGLTPEMLPMIVTTTLAKGAVLLSRKKVIVKRLDAIQNFGAMDVLCTDKTGTLTQDKIVLARHTDVFGAPSDEVLKCAYLNSYYQTGLKNLLDHAVLERAELQTELMLAQHYKKVDEVPFDFERRRMSVVVSEREDHHELICKGAVEEILAVCSQVWMEAEGGQTVALDDAMLKRVKKITQELNAEGLRVVAVAMKETSAAQHTYSVADEKELTLIGYIAFLDPPKDSTAPALKALAAQGISVKVLTGDNELVTTKICHEVALHIKGCLLGPQIDRMSDAALALAVERNNVFAKLSPLNKERLVRAMRANGHVVGFMGDGINDAPALRAADIGISVDSAVDIAKEAADIILLEKSLMVLEAGVMEGRRTFSNMLKYIRMTASSNFGNVFSVLVASAFLPFLPMLPMHLLVQNLLYDISQIAIPFDQVDDELIQKPLKWNPDNIGRFMVFFGPISSIFDILTYALMWFVFKATTPEQQTLFQSGWFVVGLLTQTLIVHMIRTPKIPFIESRAAWPLILTTLAIMGIGIFLPMGPFAEYFKLQALPLSYFPWLLAILLGYAVLTTLMKKFYIKRFGWQ